MRIAELFCHFIFFSFLGWVWESIYCTAKEKHWQDRGFLFGPVCPIYGFCVVGAEIFFSLTADLDLPGLTMPDWQLFLWSMAVCTIAEYLTSYFMEKKFHARWWDYSKNPLNLNGRICLFASMGFGAAGVWALRVLFPLLGSAQTVIPPFLYETMSLVFAFIIGGDLALTEASLSSLLVTIESFHQEFNEKAEETVVTVQEGPRTLVKTGRDAAKRRVRSLTHKQRQILHKIVSFTSEPGRRFKEEEKKIPEE